VKDQNNPVRDEPSTNAADHPIFVDGFKGSAEEIERQWIEKIYTGRGDREQGDRDRELSGADCTAVCDDDPGAARRRVPRRRHSPPVST